MHIFPLTVYAYIFPVFLGSIRTHTTPVSGMRPQHNGMAWHGMMWIGSEWYGMGNGEWGMGHGGNLLLPPGLAAALLRAKFYQIRYNTSMTIGRI